MSTLNMKQNFLTSTAAAAVLVTFGAAGALAQANVTASLGSGETISTSADFTAGIPQSISGSPTATTTNNNVNINLLRDDTALDIVTAVAPAENGLISASATGNISDSTAIFAFGSTTAGDTAAVGTLQAVQADVRASSTSDTHSILIENEGTGIRTFTGAALQDNNDITASATGNNGTSSITLNDGLTVSEDTAVQASVTLTAAGDAVSGADMVVNSSQEVDALEAGVALSVSSLVDDATTSTSIETLLGASVTTTNSDQASSATGNTATNSILSLGTTASITASTAISNQQSITPFFGTNVSATTQDSVISVDAGDDSAANGDGTVADSTVSLTQNTQTAAATGSTSTQILTLNASSITGEGANATIQGAAVVDLEATGDAVIGNYQSIADGVAVNARTAGNNIRSVMTDDDGPITNSTFEIDDNTQSSSATGVSTSNALSLTSGATMSAASAVASVQSMDGSVDASTILNSIANTNNVDVSGVSMLTTNNTMSARATGASASNTLSTTTATNNLSLVDDATNPGIVQNSVSATNLAQPTVNAGMALTNAQVQSGAASVTASTTGTQILTAVGLDADSSTITTDGNTVSASATANEADNAINLSFNELTGTISDAGTGVVAGLANEQTLNDGMTLTARNRGLNGLPILTQFGSDALGSSVSTSNNTVSVSARGNVTTGNDVVVDATNITSGSEAAPSVNATPGSLSATGSFISTSTQSSGADILASQLNFAGGTSNTILTDFGDDIEGSSTVVSDANVLSASATANTASNAVQLGTDATALIAASGVVGNLQQTLAAGSVSAVIGTLGSDPSAPFTSTNSGSSSTGNLTFASTNVTNGGATGVTLSFNTPLTNEEVAVLVTAGYTGAVVGGSTALLAAGATADFAIFTASASFGTGGFGDGDESFTIANFSVPGTGGSFNGAGVTVSVDDTGGGEILDSTVSVSGNIVVGEVNGNAATNAASAAATTVTGLEAAATSIAAGDLIAAPLQSDLATANVQSSAAPLSSDVAATFAIIAGNGDIDEITNSTQTVSDNLQQSFATANRATNSVDLMATNTNADTALESVQLSSATVATISELDVVANAGATNSSLALEGNRNQSVANGNIATNATTLDVTNATATGTVNASIDVGTFTATANNALASVQSVTEDVTASATTDVYNQDATRAAGNEIIDSSISLSSNSTIAQATGNNSGQTLTLGDAGTANMDRTGVLLNLQTVTVAGPLVVSSTVDQDVSVTLANTGTIPVQSSSLSLDGNSTTALARSNVSTNTLSVDGANITAGDGAGATNAAFSETGNTLVAAYVLGSGQTNDASVTATTTQSRVEVDMSAAANAIDSSTLSLSGNTSSATALANTVVNNVSVGANAANVDATAALGNNQNNTEAVGAIGGSAVGVFADSIGVTIGGTDPSGIIGSSVMLSGNASASNATGNQAQNTLTAAGANITSGTVASAAVNAQTGSALTANAGNLLLSDQINSGPITSTNTANVVTISSSTVDGTGAAAEGSTLSVLGNTTTAQATANMVLNSSISVGGASTTSVGASGLIGNFQFNDDTGDVEASASTTTTVTMNGAVGAAALNNGSAFVQNNSTRALARGNVVDNILSAEGAIVGAGTSPATINSNGSPDTGVLNASFGVFNEQVQQAEIEATSDSARYAINATSGTGNALNTASASVGGNSIDATAFGNIATNSVMLTSLNGAGNNASAAIFNGQINSGAITATASNGAIGVYSTGGVSGASVGVMGNSITATAVGNFATSIVTRATR